jgi:hypothetical protein
MPLPTQPPESTPSQFRTTLVRVLIVQAISLTLLALVQIVYNQ